MDQDCWVKISWLPGGLGTRRVPLQRRGAGAQRCSKRLLPGWIPLRLHGGGDGSGLLDEDQLAAWGAGHTPCAPTATWRRGEAVNECLYRARLAQTIEYEWAFVYSFRHSLMVGGQGWPSCYPMRLIQQARKQQPHRWSWHSLRPHSFQIPSRPAAGEPWE